MIDPGPGSVRMAARAGYGLSALRGVILTHFHVDHCLDLFALVFGLRHPDHAGQPLCIVGPAGTRDLCERMTQVFGDWVRLPGERTRFVELEPGPLAVDVEGLELRGASVRMPHLAHSLGYRLQGERRWLAYSGDSGDGPAVVELGRDADVFVLEAAVPEGSAMDRHLTVTRAAELAALCGCRHLVLTHFYPDTAAQDLEGLARRHYSGPLTLAVDLGEIEL